jgi:hypothetical protein
LRDGEKAHERMVPGDPGEKGEIPREEKAHEGRVSCTGVKKPDQESKHSWGEKP